MVFESLYCYENKLNVTLDLAEPFVSYTHFGFGYVNKYVMQFYGYYKSVCHLDFLVGAPLYTLYLMKWEQRMLWIYDTIYKLLI